MRKKIQSIICMVLCAAMLSACGGGAKTTSSEQTESGGKTDNSVVSSETESVAEDGASENNGQVSSDQKQPSVSDVTYGEQSNASKKAWTKFAENRKTVSNLPNYVFNEDDYSDTVMTGGSAVRAREFVRGAAYGAYHATEGWNLSEKTKAKDEANFKELAIMSIRDYTGGLNVQGGYDYYNSLGRTLSDTYALDTGQSILENGKPGGHLWINQNSLEQCIKKVVNNLSQITDTTAMEVMLLGNEEQWKNQYIDENGVWTGQYYDSGFDPETLSAFRNNWLKNRYGNIKNLNKLLGTEYKSFTDIDPNDTIWIKTEFWLFRRTVFEDFYHKLYDAAKKVNPLAKLGLAKYIGRTPDSDDVALSFMDYGCQNLYVEGYGDMFWYTSKMAQLYSISGGKPCFNTESGFKESAGGKLTNDTLERAARSFKQLISLTYMQPQMQGMYVYQYSGTEDLSIDFSWGITSPMREKRPAYYAVKQAYNDIKYLDTFMVGVSSSPLVGITHRLIDQLCGNGSNDSEVIMHPLSTMGVGVTVVTADDAASIDNFKLDRLILNDIALNQNPDGSNDVGTALKKYLADGDNKMLTFNRKVPYSVFNKINAFTASDIGKLTAKYDNFEYKNVSKADYNKTWEVLAPFVHGDFVNGKVAARKGTLNESAVRILDTFTTGDSEKRWDIQQKLLYKNGRIYLELVNCGDEPIDQITVTLGVNKGVNFNLHPEMLRCDGAVTVSKPSRAVLPAWTDSDAVSYGSIVIDGLDTYAYVDLGMAYVK